MRVVTITMVRNEADIVEAFVRYHAAVVDCMVILENGSSDKTPEILARLADEGLPLVLLFDDAPAYQQAEIMTRLLRLALDELAPDVVVPLDADEFLGSTERPVREHLATVAGADAPAIVEWKTYVPTADDAAEELNPIRRIRFRRSEQRNNDKKVIIPARIAAGRRLCLRQGSHCVKMDDGSAVEGAGYDPDLFLAHYPIRSPEQARAKYLVGWLANLARPRQVLFDWLPYYNRLKSGGRVSTDDLDQLARYYNVKGPRVGITLVEEPLLPASALELRYTPREADEPLRTVLAYAESLARHFSASAFDESQHKPHATDGYGDQLVLQTIRDYRLFDGSLSPLEAIALYKLARTASGDDPVVCEVGAALGRSTYVLARALDDHPGATFYRVDSSDTTSSALMNRLGTGNRIRVVQGTGEIAAASVAPAIDLVLINGNRDGELVERDYQTWTAKLRPGGWLAVRGVGSTTVSGPRRVVLLFVANKCEWEEQRLVGDLYIARRSGSGS
jgi:predicted O-methyltransferase YrrM